MNIYYIYFLITLIFLGIIVLIYYNFNKNIEKFTSSIENTLRRDGTLECSWSNTEDSAHDCHGKTGNEVCTQCPDGQEPTNFNGDGFICTPVSECVIPNCVAVSSNDFYATPDDEHTEHLGYKLFKTNSSKTISEIKMNDPACSPSRQCPYVNLPSCENFNIVTAINDDEKLCCKYDRLDSTRTDIDSCPPAPSDCSKVFKYEHFPEAMKDDDDDIGVKLTVVKNDNDSIKVSPTWANGAAYAFRASNYPPVTELDECPEHDVIYSNLNEKGNCVTVYNDAYCCLNGVDNKPTLVHGMYPACDLTYVNLLNSVNKPADVLVTSNIIQMYSGYNLFDTNFYHVVHASNAEDYGFLSNDVFYGCIDDDGSLTGDCKPSSSDDEFVILQHDEVSAGITGDNPDLDTLLALENSTPLKIMGAGTTSPSSS